MGLFDRGLPQISKERIRKVLDSQGWAYEVDEDGDVSAAWDEGVYTFLIFGPDQEVFTVRATWFRWLRQDQMQRAMEFCTKWNRERLWPKVYPQVDVEGKLRIHAEHNVDYESGLTDAQLLQHIRTMLMTGADFFEHATAEFPDAVEG